MSYEVESVNYVKNRTTCRCILNISRELLEDQQKEMNLEKNTNIYWPVRK